MDGIIHGYFQRYIEMSMPSDDGHLHGYVYMHAAKEIFMGMSTLLGIEFVFSLTGDWVA